MPLQAIDDEREREICVFLFDKLKFGKIWDLGLEFQCWKNKHYDEDNSSFGFLKPAAPKTKPFFFLSWHCPYHTPQNPVDLAQLY